MTHDLPERTALHLLTLQIGKTQLMLRRLRGGDAVNHDGIVACLEEVQRLSWEIARVIAAPDGEPPASGSPNATTPP